MPGRSSPQGQFSLCRKGGYVSTQLQVAGVSYIVGSSGVAAVSGPMLLGMQMLYGFNYSVTLSNICISATTTIGMTWPPPPPPP